MPEPRQTLPGSDRAAHHDMRAAGRVAGGDPITVSVYLRPESTGPVAAEAPAAVHSRATLRQVREEAQAANIAAVTAFAAAAGLDVIEVDAAQRRMQLRGSASAMEAAFGTELHHYERDGASYRGREGTLSLPADVAEHVLAVLGLDTTPVATAKFVPHRGTTQPTGFLPTEVAALYGLGSRQAAGQCIGIIELGGGYTAADNTVAFEAMDLPVPDIVAIGIGGAANNPGDTSGANGEVALDIQVAGGVAPGARLAIYFAPNTSQGFADAISQAVHDETNKPSVLSISWGGPESGWTGQAIAAMSAAFRDAAMLGVTVTAASGDSLATDGATDGKAHVDYPASDPLVLGCGGTRVTAAAGKRHGETVWKSNGGGTGGGVSALFAKPDYQAKANVPAAGTAKGGRGVPDVAGDADPDSGYRIVTGGKTGLIGGTSAVAPLWAAIVAGLNAHRSSPVGQMQAALYGTPVACHDITKGDNRSGAVGYDAAGGWDPCTGLGSPNGPEIEKLFAVTVAG
ncbi:protease pro-enzyme activation domain-containing protein [uncultured Sphingomonas sp.]|uniref:S53 family peptidase n=1 Tax=uncultured Sphingomonas sp. TaxID=158754 RepID=UPI0035CB8677